MCKLLQFYLMMDHKIITLYFDNGGEYCALAFFLAMVYLILLPLHIHMNAMAI